MKKIVPVLLSLSLVLGSVSFAAAEPEEKPFTHVVLADSAHIGFALGEFFNPCYGGGAFSAADCSGFEGVVRGALPDLMETHLKTKHPAVKTYQYGFVGLRTYDIRYFLDPSYPADEYVRDSISRNIDGIFRGRERGELTAFEERIAYLRELYGSAVKEADLITIELGGNDFFSWVFTAKNGISVDLETYLKDLRYTSKASDLRKEMMEKLGQYLPAKEFRLLPRDVQNFLEALIAGYIDATVGMDQLIACIRDLNPDARIVVSSVVNLMKDYSLRLADGTVMPLPIIGNVLCEMTNTYRRTLSPYAGEYYFADFSNAAITTIAEELAQPVSEYTEDALFTARDVLARIGVDFTKVPFEDAAERARELFSATNVVRESDVVFETMSPVRNESVIRYLETGCELSAEEYADVSTYVASIFRLLEGKGCHPSTQGYLDKLPAFVSAVDTEKTPRAYNAAATVAEMHEKADEVREVTKTVVKTVSETIRSGIRSAIGKINERRNAWK